MSEEHERFYKTVPMVGTIPENSSGGGGTGLQPVVCGKVTAACTDRIGGAGVVMHSVVVDAQSDADLLEEMRFTYETVCSEGYNDTDYTEALDFEIEARGWEAAFAVAVAKLRQPTQSDEYTQGFIVGFDDAAKLIAEEDDYRAVQYRRLLTLEDVEAETQKLVMEASTQSGVTISEWVSARLKLAATQALSATAQSDALQAENEALRHDLERQMTIANEHVNEAERLRDALREALEAAPIISLWESKEDCRHRQDGWLKTKYQAALEQSK